MNDDETLSNHPNQESSTECDPLSAPSPLEEVKESLEKETPQSLDSPERLPDRGGEDPASDLRSDPALDPAPNEGSELERLRGELTALRRELDARGALWSRLGRECEEFQALYPDTSISELDDGIWEDVRRGIPIAAAFALAERKRARTEEIAEASNQSNLLRSSGAVTGLENDYFSPSEVRAMSRHEVRKNYQKIVKSMKTWH